MKKNDKDFSEKFGKVLGQYCLGMVSIIEVQGDFVDLLATLGDETSDYVKILSANLIDFGHKLNELGNLK